MNKRCPTAEDISAYLDGELCPTASLHVDNHLLECPQCRRKIQDMRLIGEYAADEPGPPPDLLPAIMERVQCERHAAERGMGWLRWKPLPLALAASVIITLGTVLGNAFMHPPMATDSVVARLGVFDVIPPGGICVEPEACYKVARP